MGSLSVTAASSVAVEQLVVIAPLGPYVSTVNLNYAIMVVPVAYNGSLTTVVGSIQQLMAHCSSITVDFQDPIELV